MPLCTARSFHCLSGRGDPGKDRGEENYPALKVLGKGFVYVSSPLEFWEELKVGVLTVSDKGSRDKEGTHRGLPWSQLSR